MGYIKQSIFDLYSTTYDAPITKFFYNADGLIEYIGTNNNFDADDTHRKWDIKRFWYNGDKNVIKIKKQTGKLSEKEILNWGV